MEVFSCNEVNKKGNRAGCSLCDYLAGMKFHKTASIEGFSSCLKFQLRCFFILLNDREIFPS